MASRKQQYKVTSTEDMMGYSIYTDLGLDNVVNLLEPDDKLPVVVFQLVFEIEF